MNVVRRVAKRDDPVGRPAVRLGAAQLVLHLLRSRGREKMAARPPGLTARGLPGPQPSGFGGLRPACVGDFFASPLRLPAAVVQPLYPANWDVSRSADDRDQEPLTLPSLLP